MTYTLKRRGLTQVDLSARGKRIATFTAPLAGRRRGRRDRRSAASGSYRGVLEFAPSVFSGLTVVNSVALDEYLQGVVPAESPASWPAEALQRAGDRRPHLRDHDGQERRLRPLRRTRARRSTRASGSRPRPTNAAVADTRGQIVTYQGQPVVTYFFSTSGGRTEAVENTSLGNEPKPWLKSVEDEFDSVSPRHRWTHVELTMASGVEQARLARQGHVQGHPGDQARQVAADHDRRGGRLARRDDDRRRDAARAARAVRHVGVLHRDQRREGEAAAPATGADPSGGATVPPRSYSLPDASLRWASCAAP